MLQNNHYNVLILSITMDKKSTAIIEKYNFTMYIVNLYNVRWTKRYTHEDIAKATNLSFGTVNKLFSGKYYDYKLSTLEAISKFFNCSIYDILIEVEDED